MTSPLSPGDYQLSSNLPAGRPRRLEPHQASPQSSSRQTGRRDPSRVHHPGPAMMPSHSSSMPSRQGYYPNAHTSTSNTPRHSSHALHNSTPERPSRRNVNIFDVHNENITEAEAYKRLTSYIVISIKRATDPYDLDGDEPAPPPTWEKASHLIRRDVSQQEARRKVRKLDKETGSAADKKKDLPSAIQRQLERAWRNLEETEGDTRFVYTLAQVDWKLTGGREEKHGGRSKEKRRSRERRGSKTKREWASVTAYFKREPGRNEDCVRILKAQLAERRQGRRGVHDDRRLPLRSSGQVPLPRNVQEDTSRSQGRHFEHEPRIQRRSSMSQHSDVAHRPVRAARPRTLPQNTSAAPIPIPPRSDISQAIEAQNRRIQSHAARTERQATAGSYNSRSSITSFSSLSTEDSGTKMTPSSSVEQSHSLTPPPQLHQPHRQYHGRSRGRSSYRQHHTGDESVVLEVARPQRLHNPAYRVIRIPPAAPDPISAVSEADMRRRPDQRTYHDGLSRSMGQGSTPRQPRGIEDPQESVRAPLYLTGRNPSGRDQDMDQLGDRLSRTSLAGSPRSHPGEARDAVNQRDYIEAPRRYRDVSEDDGFVMPRPAGGIWRRRDAQRYMAERRQTDQDGWDLGRTSPLLYEEGQRRVSSYAGYRR
ncbi:hypothetical protein V8C44DRAFT_322358 [Trichoderma aethiopicum]